MAVLAQTRFTATLAATEQEAQQRHIAPEVRIADEDGGPSFAGAAVFRH